MRMRRMPHSLHAAGILEPSPSGSGMRSKGATRSGILECTAEALLHTNCDRYSWHQGGRVVNNPQAPCGLAAMHGGRDRFVVAE